MKSERILLAVVIVSVGLNLLLGGIMLGQLAGPDRDGRRLDPMMGVRRVLTDLPESRSEALAPHFQRYFSALRPRFREIRGVQKDVKAAMLTDPLDETALAEALGAFQSVFSESQRSARDAFIGLAAAMTLAERQQLVSAMNGPPHRADGIPERSPHGRPPVGDRPPGFPLPP
ncbi:MAG: periplasmic heavy metal sensor [Pseudomonadales bacterium]